MQVLVVTEGRVMCYGVPVVRSLEIIEKPVSNDHERGGESLAIPGRRIIAMRRIGEFAALLL